PWVRVKADFSRYGFTERGRTCDLQRWIAHQVATAHLRQLLKSKGHRGVESLNREADRRSSRSTGTTARRFADSPFHSCFQRGKRFSIKACTPSSAASSIMLQAMV